MTLRPAIRALLPSLLLPALLPVGSSKAADLSFPERVAAQEAIERVYHSHRLGDSRPFEETLAPGDLERRVRESLLLSRALERFWGTPVTAAALHRELERIAADTRAPERLREVYQALGNDPLLVQETFVRDVLVQRLARSFFDGDESIHAAARKEAEDVRRWMARGRLPGGKDDPAWSEAELILGDPGDSPFPRTGGITLRPEEFARRRARLPREVGEVGPVVEERDRFLIQRLLEASEGSVRIGTYSVPKRSWEDWWSEASADLDAGSVPTVALAGGTLPEPEDTVLNRDCLDDLWDNGSLDDIPEGRIGQSTVWTGTEMIVWGGTGLSPFLRSGGRYDPLIDTWRPLTQVNAPVGRRLHTAVWTGTEMIIWGGENTQSLNSGSRYDPASDSWTPVTDAGAPAARSDHTAVWTGDEMIVWGGSDDGSALFTGGRYDPAGDVWTPTSTAGIPAVRTGHVALWTGQVMVVWGGNGSGDPGGRYYPATDSWLPVTEVGAPPTRTGHSGVWTGTEAIFWGGSHAGEALDGGGRYDPVADTWTLTSRTGAPAPRHDHTTVWTGTRMIIWGGNAGSPQNTGGIYDPVSNSWTATPLQNAPTGRGQHGAVWTGSLMIVWGGYEAGDMTNTGGRYNPATNGWTPTATANGQDGQKDHSAIWTGTEMIIWGGFNAAMDTYLDSGSRYDPLTDSWTGMTLSGAPSGRELQQAAWTGTEMILWGGFDGSQYLDTGARYDPATDSWSPLSLTGAPSPRQGTASIWTGTEFIVWGGFQAGNYLGDGYRYDPATDTWAPVSAAGAPSPRCFHSAVWTGDEMLIWGGAIPVGVARDGGRYDPQQDSWVPLPISGAPTARTRHSAVWADGRMVIWGGFDGTTYLSTGGALQLSSGMWRASSLTNAPEGRVDQAVVWTGREMLVWGGFDGSLVPRLDTGGRYNPITDKWRPISLEEAPSARTGHTAVWTGEDMLVWGGSDGSELNSGGRYLVGKVLPPEEVGGLAFADPTMLAWDPALYAEAYELIRGAGVALPVESGGGEMCLQVVETYAPVTEAPSTGTAFWYLARGTNVCGPGTAGYESSNLERLTGCP